MQKAILNNPNSAVQFDHFGDILFRLGEIENAVQYWKKALVLDPENASLIKKMNQKRIVE
jgi:cytochrome c-type biogenesis protein CcmH/NrfG